MFEQLVATIEEFLTEDWPLGASIEARHLYTNVVGMLGTYAVSVQFWAALTDLEAAEIVSVEGYGTGEAVIKLTADAVAKARAKAGDVGGVFL